MKKNILRVMTFVFAIVMLVNTVFASEHGQRSSLYLDAYRAWLTPESGAIIDVTIHVQAVDDMDDVGALSVEMFESTDGGATWSRDGIYLSALHDELLEQDTYLYYDTPISHQGTAGYKYYAIVTVYAGDSTGSDSKTYNTTIVTARR